MNLHLGLFRSDRVLSEEAVLNCKKYLKENLSDEYEFISNAPNPFLLVYEPCMDLSPLLLPDEASYFQNIIVVMRWMVELGRIDIAVKV